MGLQFSNRTLLQSTSTRKPMGKQKVCKGCSPSQIPLVRARVSGTDDLPYLWDSRACSHLGSPAHDRMPGRQESSLGCDSHGTVSCQTWAWRMLAGVPAPEGDPAKALTLASTCLSLEPICIPRDCDWDAGCHLPIESYRDDIYWGMVRIEVPRRRLEQVLTARPRGVVDNAYNWTLPKSV